MNLSDQLAIPQTVNVGGRSLRLRPLTLADYAEIEQRIIAGRPDPLAEIAARLAGASPDERRAALEQLLDKLGGSGQVSMAELDQWWQTSAGLCRRFWLMVRSEHPDMTLADAAGRLAEIGAAGRAALARRIVALYGWPRDHVDGFASEGTELADGDGPAFAWRHWLLALSRAYGWTPAEVGRLTFAQAYSYLGQSCDSSRYRRMSAAEGAEFCRRRRESRQRRIDEMLRELSRGDASQPVDTPSSRLAAGGLPADTGAATGGVDGDRHPSEDVPVQRLVQLDVQEPATVRQPPANPIPFCGPAAIGRVLAAEAAELPSAALAGLHNFARDLATQSNQREQIELARQSLAEQKKTNQCLGRRPGAGAAVFGP
jgi:hypothetical protein